MLVRTFKTSYTFNHVALWLAGVVLWIPGFRELIVFAPGELTPLSGIVCTLFGDARLSATVGYLLLLIEAYFLNYVLINNNIAPRNTIFTAFFYMLCMSTANELLTVHPVLLANLFIIAALNNLLKTYASDMPHAHVMNTSLLLSIASFFYAPAAWLLVFVWITFIVYRIDQWREWVISIIGFVLPYLFLFTWYFWTDSTDVLSEHLLSIIRLSITLPSAPGTTGLVILALLLILFLQTFATLINKVNEQKILVRKKVWCMVWLMVCSLLPLFIAHEGSPFIPASLSFVALSGFAVFHLFHTRKSLWFEALVHLLAIAVLINNYLF